MRSQSSNFVPSEQRANCTERGVRMGPRIVIVAEPQMMPWDDAGTGLLVLYAQYQNTIYGTADCLAQHVQPHAAWLLGRTGVVDGRLPVDIQAASRRRCPAEIRSSPSGGPAASLTAAKMPCVGR